MVNSQVAHSSCDVLDEIRRLRVFLVDYVVAYGRSVQVYFRVRLDLQIVEVVRFLPRHTSHKLVLIGRVLDISLEIIPSFVSPFDICSRNTESVRRS